MDHGFKTTVPTKLLDSGLLTEHQRLLLFDFALIVDSLKPETS